MRGISEKDLKDRQDVARRIKDYVRSTLIDELISECKELNPWLPIDENTPKDRRLNLYWKGYGWFTGQWRMGQFFCDAGLLVPVNVNPTHYQELPADPKE